MSDLNDADFYLRRERQERMLAARARDAAISSIHEEMARRYAELAMRARPAPPRRLRIA